MNAAILTPITREEAKEKGLPRFYNPDYRCRKQRHQGEQYTRNGGCVTCKQNVEQSGRADGIKAANNTQTAALPIPALDNTELADLSNTGFTTTGLDLDRALTKEEWTSLCIVAEKTKSVRQWLIGDLWNSCEWGDKATRMESMNINPKSAREYARVCTKIPHELRRPGISFGHHAELCTTVIDRQAVEAGVEVEAMIAQALDRIETTGMSVADTRTWVRNLAGSLAEGDLEGGEDDGTEGSQVFNPFYGLPAAIKRAMDSVDNFADEDIQRIEQFKQWVEAMTPSDPE